MLYVTQLPQVSIRCSLYHEVSTPEITETDIERFREIVSAVLYELHGIVVVA